jgi:uncharacterized protein (DUF1697 family)
VPTYVALLRGINLGARNKVAMADLRALVEALGGEDVRTYVQSGNVVFKGSLGGAKAVASAMEKRISADLGLDVAVLVRTGAELRKLVAANPFVKGGRDASKLHVTFLADKPGRDKVRALPANEHEPDEFRVVGREIYLHYPKGYGRSKLSNAFFEKRLGVTATTRNWRTVTNLAGLVEGR